VKEPGLRIVLIHFEAVGRLPEHVAAGPTSLQTLMGHLRIRARGETTDLSAGSIMPLGPGAVHDVEALDESTFF
jgi:quercetin dioxygenase-like cupin family protein